MSVLDRFSSDPLGAALYVLGLVVALSLHELGHAWAAVSQGDETPRNEGRLSLNPLRHLDPLGTALILLVGFGWARPVVTRPDRYRNPVWGQVLVSVAGIAMNLLLVLVAGLALRFLATSARAGNAVPEWALQGLFDFVGLNVLLAVFNALPVPPLDGSHLLAALVPGELGNSLRYWSNRSSYLLLVALLLLRGPISSLIGGAQKFVFDLLL